MPKFGMKVPHFRCDLHTSFKVEVMVSSPLMLTHLAAYLPNANLLDATGMPAPVSLDAGSGISCWPNSAATFLVASVSYEFFYSILAN